MCACVVVDGCVQANRIRQKWLFLFSGLYTQKQLHVEQIVTSLISPISCITFLRGWMVFISGTKSYNPDHYCAKRKKWVGRRESTMLVIPPTLFVSHFVSSAKNHSVSLEDEKSVIKFPCNRALNAGSLEMDKETFIIWRWRDWMRWWLFHL